MAVNVVKSIVLTLLGGLSIALTTWGLIMIGSEPNAATYAILGLLAYLVSWSIALYAIAR
mgnify:FL=1